MRTQQHIFNKEQIRVRSQKERAPTVKRQRPKSKSRLQLLTGLTKSADNVLAVQAVDMTALIN